MNNFFSNKIRILFLFTILLGSILIINTTINQDYFNPVIQYEIHYNPDFVVDINKSLQPPTHIERYYQGSISDTNLFMDIFEIECFNDCSNNSLLDAIQFNKIYLWSAQIESNLSTNDQINIKILNISENLLLKFDSRREARFVGNSSTVWAMTRDNSAEFFQFTTVNDSLILSNKSTIPSDTLKLEGFNFIRHRDLYLIQNYLWIWEEYQNISSGQIVHFLNQFESNNLILVNNLEIPQNIQKILSIEDSNEIISINDQSIWLIIVKDETSANFPIFYQEHSWNGSLLSNTIINTADEELGFQSEDRLRLRGPMISENAFVYLIEEKQFTKSKSEFIGFYIVPFNSALKPFPLFEYSIWIGITLVGIIGIILDNKRKFPSN